VEVAKRLHPKESRIYQVAAGREMQRGKIDKALAERDAGAKAVGGNAAINLQFAKARLQIESNDTKGARQTIEDMQQSRKLAPEVNDFFEALLLVAENKWYPAVEALSKLRPRTSETRTIAADESRSRIERSARPRPDVARTRANAHHQHPISQVEQT